MQPVVLLSILGAAVLAAVSSVPVDNRNHNEEMVTRCIIEVLSNALSKSNIPSITPECRQILKKSGKEAQDEEKSENENTKFEVRLLRDPVDTLEAHKPSTGQEAGVPGEKDPQGPTRANTEKWAEEGGHSREGAEEPQGSLHPSNSQVPREVKAYHSEKSQGEDREEKEEEKYQKGERGEEASEGKPLEEPEEIQNTFLNKRNQATTKKKEELVTKSATFPTGHSEEKTHSREKSSQESGEEMGSQEKHPQESKPQSEEESEESEEDTTSEVTKRRMRPRHHHGRSRPDRSSQEGNPPSEERGHAFEESEEAKVGEKRDHHSTHYRTSEEEPEYGGEVGNYPGVQSPEDLERGQYGGRGSEEYRAPRPHSEELQEEADKRNPLSSELENMAHGYSKESEVERGHERGMGHHPRGRGREPGAYSTPDIREEKRFLGETYHHVQESQMDKAKRHPQGEWQEQDRTYLNYDEEGPQGKWQQQEDPRDLKENKEEARLQDKPYASRHTTEKRKRLGVLFNPYYDPLQWKSSRFERKDNADDSFLEGEEENGLTLGEKNFFPEYSYDWWEKKPFSDDVNWGYEKRSFARAPKLDLKRQYDRVAELDQLLHYRKKSAEFPDFYDSEEQMGPRHQAESEKETADQRVLTEEEEKELENLAAMDLELQKIAEKFSQRG
ncbi:secretogranin-1 [Sciurus carolinensis]|uniref:secretogranin-1 n=1 Tax=Sciurus carolinensis TaxID=30640 RepID=UPI001FB2235C|nr:secretogranin-1 [Sciurus carolinensis]